MSVTNSTKFNSGQADHEPIERTDPNSGEESIDPENEAHGWRLMGIHVAICLCTFLVGLDFNVIATATPVITSEFNSIKDVGWYGAAFQLGLSSTQPLAGKVYSLFSKKIVYLVSVLIFEVGSLISALAQSSATLIVGRAVAGLGASGIFAGGFAILTSIIPLHKRAIWTGTMSSTFSLASIVGPVLGGALTQQISWRWCFYINLPIGGFAGLLLFLVLQLHPAESQKLSQVAKLKSLDLTGLTLFAGSTTMLLLALNWGGDTYAWSSSVIIGLIIGSGVLLIVFVAWQLHMQDYALVPPRLFTIHRNVGLICLSAFFVNGPIQIIVYWLPIWFQVVLDATPTQSGVKYLPMVISDLLSAILGSSIVMKVGFWNPFLLLGEVTVSVGAGLLSTIYPSISNGHWIGYQILCGTGYALVTNLAHLGLQATLPKDLVSMGASTLLAIIAMSCSIFLAMGQAVFVRRLHINLASVGLNSVIYDVLHTGATNLDSVVDAAKLPAVTEAYGKSITQLFYVPAAAPVASFFLVCGCSWVYTKRNTSKVEEKSHEADRETAGYNEQS